MVGKRRVEIFLKRSVQLFGMISAIFLFRNHRNIHSIRYLLWTAGWESAPTEEKRGHEGCDLMASKDIPGLYPVVSMTDGVVSARGWLEREDTGSGLPHRLVHISIMHIWTLMEVIRRGTR